MSTQFVISKVRANLLKWFESAFFFNKNQRVSNESRRILSKYCKGRKVLDIGCGKGETLNYLKRVTSIGIGIDISLNVIKGATKNNSGNRYCVSDCLNLPFVDNAFEVAYLKHVVHHLPIDQYHKAINEAKRVAKNHVIVWDIVNTKGGLLKQLMNLYWKIIDGGHKYRTLTEWCSLLEEEGDRVIEKRITGRGRCTYVVVIDSRRNEFN